MAELVLGAAQGATGCERGVTAPTACPGHLLLPSLFEHSLLFQPLPAHLKYVKTVMLKQSAVVATLTKGDGGGMPCDMPELVRNP